MNEYTFFLIRTWRAVLSSLRVVVLAWTTKDKDEEDELGFGIGIVSGEEEEGNVQEWRNGSEEANIVKLSFKIKNHTILSFYYYIIYHSPSISHHTCVEFFILLI
jgi:hypothetical protein